MIKPIKSNILFKPFIQKGETKSGILIPFENEMDKGEIVAVGKGTKIKPMRLNADTIGYRVHAWGEPIFEKDEKYYLMDETAIIALN